MKTYCYLTSQKTVLSDYFEDWKNPSEVEIHMFEAEFVLEGVHITHRRKDAADIVGEICWKGGIPLGTNRVWIFED